MTPSRRARELVDDYGQAMLTLGRDEWALESAIGKAQEVHGNLCRYIAALEASATAPKGEAVACPQCGAPEGAICKSPFCVRLPPPSPKAEPNPSAVEAAVKGVCAKWFTNRADDIRNGIAAYLAALEAHRQDISPPAEAAELARLRKGQAEAIREGLKAVAELRSKKDAELARLREALEPFVREANRISPTGSDETIHDNCEIWQCGGFEMTRSKITYGDLRNARAALSGADHDR